MSQRQCVKGTCYMDNINFTNAYHPLTLVRDHQLATIETVSVPLVNNVGTSKTNVLTFTLTLLSSFSIRLSIASFQLQYGFDSLRACGSLLLFYVELVQTTAGYKHECTYSCGDEPITCATGQCMRCFVVIWHLPEAQSIKHIKRVCVYPSCERAMFCTNKVCST